MKITAGITAAAVALSAVPAAADCVIPARAAASDYDKFSDVIYGTFGDGPQKLDFYRSKLPGKRPLMIVVHGGGWISGSKDQMLGLAERYVAMGYHVAALDYPLASADKPTNVFPAAIQSLRCSMRFLQKQALENTAWRINHYRVGIFGSSAGSNLAAMMVHTPERYSWMDYYCPYVGTYPRIKVDVAVLFSGIYDLTHSSEYTKSRDKTYLNVPEDEHYDTAWRASPVRYVETYGSPESVPTYLAHAEVDDTVSPVQSQLMAMALQNAGATYEHHTVDWTGHTMSPFNEAEPFTANSCRAMNWIKSRLG